MRILQCAGFAPGLQVKSGCREMGVKSGLCVMD